MSSCGQRRYGISSFVEILASIAASLIGTLLYAYLWFCYRTSTVMGTREADRALSASCDAGIPSAFVFWHDEFLLISLASFWPRVPMPTIVMGAQFGGRVSARFAALRGTGVEMIHKRRHTRDQRIAQLTDALRNKKWLGIAADYGAPWYSARPTALQLAHATDGVVVPMHVEATRVVRLGYRGWSVMIPLPFGTYTIKSMAPIRPKASHASSSAKLNSTGATLLNRVLNALRSPTRAPLPSYTHVPVTE